MKKVLVLLGTAMLLLVCAGCGSASAPRRDESAGENVAAEENGPPAETVEWTGYGEVCAAEMVCRGIASADVC